MLKINILYIMQGGTPGGAELNLLSVINAIDKIQYNIRVCLFKQSKVLEEELKKINIPVFIIRITRKWHIFYIFKLAQIMRRERINIVHSCLYAPNAFGRLAAILARVPIIIAWEQGEILVLTEPPRHYKVDRILAKFTDCIVACSKACKEMIIRREHIPESKIRVIYNCIDFAKFNISADTSTIRRQLGIKSDEILIGTVGWLDNEKKGQEYLIRAMPEIIKVYPKTKLLLVGEGPSKSYFIQIIENLNIRDKVILTGFRRDIPKIMNALDIYVCSSIREALGISILEAMSLKKPVIATKVDGILEIITEGQYGCLIPPRDTDSIAQAVINLLTDPKKMQQMGEAGFTRCKAHFSSEVIIKEIEALYRKLLWKNSQRSQ